MVDYENMALDDIIRLTRVAEQPAYGRSRSRSRSTSRSTRSRSIRRELVNESSMYRSRSRSRSVSQNRPASLCEYRARRARSRSCESNRTTNTVRSQGGWQHRGRSLTRCHSRPRGRNQSCESKMNHTRQFARSRSRSRSCGVSPSRELLYGNYRTDRVSPWLLSTPHTQYERLFYKNRPLYEQNLYNAYSPKYLQATNRPQAPIWRANVNQFYPVHSNKYFEKMKALQQLRIAQQRVRQAKRLLNNRVFLYNRLQMGLQKPLVYSSPMPYRHTPFLMRRKQKSYPQKSYPQKSYPYFRYQKSDQKFDLEDYSDGELSVTIHNDLVRSSTESSANSTEKNFELVEINDDSQDVISAEENFPEWKYNDSSTSLNQSIAI